MKSFFEEYGFVILAAIVVIILIAMATPIGDLIKIQIDNTINSFGSKTQSKLNATDGIIQVRVSTINNKIILEWDANKEEDVFKYQYKASNTKGEANWTNKADVIANEKSRTVIIENDSNNQPLTNKTKVEYKIYDSNDQLVASGVVTAKIGKDATAGGEGGVGGGTTENPTTPTETLETGTKLTIEGKNYTVIECNGTQCKVLANELANNGKTIKFDENRSNNYAISTIATYLDNDYYNSLPKSIRNAIVKTAIQQKVLKTWNGNNPTDWDTPKDAGPHNVFIPSWDEVTKIYGTTPDELKAYALNGWTWLRDTYRSLVFLVNNNGVYINVPDSVIYVRPAFVLDLSKVVDYEIK